MLIEFWAAMALSAPLAGVGAGADDAARPADVRAAVDYCLSVVAAHVAGAPPITQGPEGFARSRGAYGAEHWLKGALKAPGSISASPGEGHMCTIVANDFDASTMAAWFQSDPAYAPANDQETGFTRSVEGGWMRISWPGTPIGNATLIVVHGLKADD